MDKLDQTAEELFSKIRGRFSNVTIGDGEGNVVNDPKEARFFEFAYNDKNQDFGNVSISLSDDDGVVVMFNKEVVENAVSKSLWFEFLKELRTFSKKRMLGFNTRDITKSNLEKRDYKYLATKTGDDKMNESKLYGTSRISYQDVDSARLVIKHTESVNQELASGRTQKIGTIYIESADGERFKYPYKHLTGARAMARHVAEGGKPYDDFGKHITGLSEELSKLRKFKTYMGRSAVMAESLSEYMDIVKERIQTVKKTVEGLQKPSFYKQTVEAFETPVLEDVPSDVAENWIDQLTIRQFNEELKDVFPYIYNLVSEATKAKELGPDDLLGEAKNDCDETCPKSCPDCGGTGDPEEYEKTNEGERHGNSKIYDKCWKGYRKVPGKKAGEKGSCVKAESEIERGFEEMMGQFGEGFDPDEFEGEFDYDAVGDDGEEDAATVTYKANIDDNGRPVVDPKSIEVHASGNNPSSKLGHDVQGDTEMQDMKELLQMAQEDADEMWDSRDNKYAHGEGNAYAHAVRQAKMDGKKKGDKVKGPDGDEITIEKDEKTPLGEFILSYYDRETGEFPKGETAVLTMVEKDYGEQFIEPAKAFIEQVNTLFDDFQMKTQPQQMEVDTEYERMRELAGLR
ncbi:MAG: hypothetical protein VW551_00005 [Euryarchaeota archaeon]|jgi:hypothetical protein